MGSARLNQQSGVQRAYAFIGFRHSLYKGISSDSTRRMEAIELGLGDRCQHAEVLQGLRWEALTLIADVNVEAATFVYFDVEGIGQEPDDLFYLAQSRWRKVLGGGLELDVIITISIICGWWVYRLVFIDHPFLRARIPYPVAG